MTVLVRCPLVSCNKLTGWQYPNFQWAMAHVPGLPSRSFVPDDKYPGWESVLRVPSRLCPDPLGHVNKFKTARGDPALEVERPRSADVVDETSGGSNPRS